MKGFLKSYENHIRYICVGLSSRNTILSLHERISWKLRKSYAVTYVFIWVLGIVYNLLGWKEFQKAIEYDSTKNRKNGLSLEGTIEQKLVTLCVFMCIHVKALLCTGIINVVIMQVIKVLEFYWYYDVYRENRLHSKWTKERKL